MVACQGLQAQLLRAHFQLVDLYACHTRSSAPRDITALNYVVSIIIAIPLASFHWFELRLFGGVSCGAQLSNCSRDFQNAIFQVVQIGYY